MMSTASHTSHSHIPNDLLLKVAVLLTWSYLFVMSSTIGWGTSSSLDAFMLLIEILMVGWPCFLLSSFSSPMFFISWVCARQIGSFSSNIRLFSFSISSFSRSTASFLFRYSAFSCFVIARPFFLASICSGVKLEIVPPDCGLKILDSASAPN